MADAKTHECLTNALKATQLLRANVSKVFETLTQGFSTGDDKQQISKYLDEFQKSLLKVNENFSELEKQANNIHPATPIRQGNLGLLSVEAFPQHLASIYPKIVNTYKWSERAHTYADRCIENLQSTSLKRSYLGTRITSKPAKPFVKCPHTVPDEVVDSVLHQFISQPFPNVSVSWSRPLGSPPVVLVKVGRIMTALFVLRGLLIELVNVKSFTENFLTDSGKVDVWTPSKFQVFKKITQHAKAASLYISNPESPDLTVKEFVTWLRSYSTLFSEPCVKCKKHLKDFLPPTWRDFQDFTPYHEGCRS